MIDAVIGILSVALWTHRGGAIVERDRSGWKGGRESFDPTRHFRGGTGPRWPNRVQYVRNETAHVDGGAYRAIEKEEGQEKGRERIRL